MPSSWAAERDVFGDLTDGGRIRHQPGLDGLRGLAVAAVVVFHTGLGWLPGGYLGVSLFFTISGVVIGTVILNEIATPGGFSLRGFWSRRARRLLPAAWLVLAAVAVLRVTTTVFSSTRSSDVVASFLQVANWHFLAEDTSYGALFSGPSAVLHFWSLAIEEQFYLVIGAGAVALAAWSRRPVRDLAIGATGLAAVSFALPFVFSMSVDRTYYGTDTRAGELLVGLAIAALIADRGRREAILRRWRPLALAAVAAAVVTLGLWRVLDADTAGLATGVLPLTALLSCGLVAGALVPGPLRFVTSWGPLRRLGDISYALYLVHWPVFVIVRHADPDPSITSLALATAVAVALAILSTRLIEAPVRARRVPPGWVGVGAAMLIGATAVALVSPAERTAAEDLIDDIEEAAAAGPGILITAAPQIDERRPLVAVFGDSVALTLGMTMPRAANEAHFDPGPAHIGMGCGVALSPARLPADVARCNAMVATMASQVREDGADAVVVMSCQWELVEQALPGTTDELAPGDATFDAFVREAYTRAAGALRAAGAEDVLWVRCPRLSTVVVPPGIPPDLLASRDPARTAAVNAIVDDLAAHGVVEVVDLAAWVDPRVDDATLRPDGSHYAFDVDTGVASELTRLINESLAS